MAGSRAESVYAGFIGADRHTRGMIPESENSTYFVRVAFHLERLTTKLHQASSHSQIIFMYGTKPWIVAVHGGAGFHSPSSEKPVKHALRQ